MEKDALSHVISDDDRHCVTAGSCLLFHCDDDRHCVTAGSCLLFHCALSHVISDDEGHCVTAGSCFIVTTELNLGAEIQVISVPVAVGYVKILVFFRFDIIRLIWSFRN